MTAAIIICSFAGLALVLWRKDVFTFGLGLALLVVSTYLFWDHWEWLQDAL